VEEEEEQVEVEMEEEREEVEMKEEREDTHLRCVISYVCQSRDHQRIPGYLRVWRPQIRVQGDNGHQCTVKVNSADRRRP